jgi:hypothetical protein
MGYPLSGQRVQRKSASASASAGASESRAALEARAWPSVSSVVPLTAQRPSVFPRKARRVRVGVVEVRDILGSMQDAGSAPQLYNGIDQFIAALRGTHETGRLVALENGHHPGILVRLDGRAIGAVALERGETREMLSARLQELLN